MLRRTRKALQASSYAHLVPVSGDLDELVVRVAAHRSRSITLMPTPLPEDAPSGLWVATTARDYIVYPDNADAQWRSGIVCHELAHMLLEHDPQPGTADLGAMVSRAAPSIDPQVAARFLHRHGYEDTAEADAEYLGTRLAARLGAAHTTGQRHRDRVFDRMR
jgi:hypothetical protein